MHSSFFLLFLASYHSPAPAWVLHGPQSLWGCPCSRMSPPRAAVTQNSPPSSGVPSSKRPSSVTSPTISPSTFLLLFIQTCLFTYLLTAPFLSVLLCLISCFLFLCLLPPAAATLLQAHLSRGTMCSSGWLKVWGMTGCFHPFQSHLEPAVTGTGWFMASFYAGTLQPLLPNQIFYIQYRVLQIKVMYYFHAALALFPQSHRRMQAHFCLQLIQ